MNKNEMVSSLNEIIKHERKHFNFYLQALMTIKGAERQYLKPLLEAEMNGELSHIRMFGDKVVAYGGLPTTECLSYPSNCQTGTQVLGAAIEMERAVLVEYHNLYPKAEDFALLNADMSVVLMLEENIEHTTADVEEMEKILHALTNT